VPRILFISIQGHVTQDVMLTSLLAIPVIAITTFVAKKLPMPFGEQGMRRFSFGLLVAMAIGVFLSSASSIPQMIS
jgi:hypothetical protein